jgi:ATP-dependent DNA helicase RecQ
MDWSPAEENPAAAFVDRCAALDLETLTDGKIIKIGALFRGNTFARQGHFSLDQALPELAAFCREADFLLGHNILGHDLPILRDRCPQPGVPDRPVIDTLYLSPLAFPENPYHHLVKNYKLVRDSVNDPVADARLALQLFRDQWASLSGLRQTCPEVIDFYGYCFRLAAEPAPQWRGLADLFRELGAREMRTEEAPAVLRHILDGKVCLQALRGVTRDCLWDPEECLPLSYCLSWLRVAGHNSILPPWVRHRFPKTVTLLQRLREVPCNDPQCAYCRRVHNPTLQLQRLFGLDSFRPFPAAEDGSSLQEQIVRHALEDRSLLAILPTGGGKSLCYQLPALVRNFRRGVLTIIISPLQALMKDQVDNLIDRTGVPLAAALYGMLTPPERRQVLEGVRLGNVALLYVSPEQLRNRSFRETILEREIGCWVFDEAHCLSKWGHDFRPDYLYASRFIRDLAREQNCPVPPIACFTATAKKEVQEEICDHFRRELGQELRPFVAGVERNNLRFKVLAVKKAEKYSCIYELLRERLDEQGAAVVYAATRHKAEKLNEFLQAKDLASERFHAGLAAPEKRHIQEAFQSGEIRVICATNAFGMGIDKDDVRLVIHADIPGSLENYLQEAGRAGRDQQAAECILLYDEGDVESQFRLGAVSELDHRDVAQILRGLRLAQRNREGEIVLTTGDLLRNDEVETSFDSDDPQADTKIRTAVSWLERDGFIQRDLNVTNAFQGRPAVSNLAEARRKIAPLNLSAKTRERWLEILLTLFNADPDDGLNMDRLAELPCFAPEKDPDSGLFQVREASREVLRTLFEMARAGLIHQDMLLTAFVRHKVKNPSLSILNQVLDLEQGMLRILQEAEPDPEGWLDISLRRVNQRLLDAGFACVPPLLLRLLNSLSLDGKGLAGKQGSLDLKMSGPDFGRIRLNRNWQTLQETVEIRSGIARLLLETIIARIPGNAPAAADLLVEFSYQDLEWSLRQDLFLSRKVTDPLAAIERALMFMHEQKVIILQKGLTVFRQAMTIRILDPKRRYTKKDFSPLAQHYRQRIFQIHVMNEYARLGLEKIRQALGLVAAYFVLDKKEFIARFFPGRKEMLERSTGQESFQRIVTSLENEAQIGIVSAPAEQNMLVLAGPGSGKTRVVVHRCAFLLRVERVPARSIIILCFNRQAALELRHRLKNLVGAEAAGVTVLTYHAMAMRLTGHSFAERFDRCGPENMDFDAVVDRAVRLLRGEEEIPGIDSDTLRDQLLTGYRHILVDEYQDIDQRQYDLVSALAGRTEEADAKLTIMAVGDDDQNIYAFRGASVRFIQRFQKDYDARYCYLVENFRSTGHIITAANLLISKNRERMKTAYPIRINQGRRDLPPGGDFSALDPIGRGRLRILQVENRAAQANAVVTELLRLRSLAPHLRWSQCAVLAATHEELATLRSALEYASLPVSVNRRTISLPLGRVREIRRFLAALKDSGKPFLRGSDLGNTVREMAGKPAGNPWWQLLLEEIETYQEATGDAELPLSQVTENIWEALAERRGSWDGREGVFLSTVHAAKGTEFSHVLVADGGWAQRPDKADPEERRRTYYVAMTRARETLTLLERRDDPNGFTSDLAAGLSEKERMIVPFVPDNPLPEQALNKNYDVLGLADLFLDYAGRQPEGHPIHTWLAALSTGSRLRMGETDRGGIALMDGAGHALALLSRAAVERWRPRLSCIEEVHILAMIERRREDVQAEGYGELVKTERWEVPVCEVLFRRGISGLRSA